MKYIILICSFFCTQTSAQPPQYSAQNGHSHNDYAQKRPFKTAFEAGMGSIEADVYLVNNNLFVAHNASEILPENTLDSLYLKPLVQALQEGKIYPLSILIDIKSDAETTLQEVVAQIGRYPTVFNDSSLVRFVISGRRPNSDKWANYPKFILFDGRPYENYSDEAWAHVGMVSDNFKNYTSLTNKDINDPSVFSKLKTMVDAVHAKGKKVRLWETADTEAMWAKLKELGVDFINTDTPNELKAFLSE